MVFRSRSPSALWELEDGSLVKGFLVEPTGIEGALEITHLGGWRGYLASLA